MSIPDATPTTPAPAVLLTAHRIRNPWVAVGLTLLVPGLGHLYDGRVRRAGAVWLLWCCATIGAFALAMALGGRAQLIAFVLIPPFCLQSPGMPHDERGLQSSNLGSAGTLTGTCTWRSSWCQQ